MVCRICSGSLMTSLDLGEIYPSAFVDGSFLGQPKRLTLTRCSDCGIAQLLETIDPDRMYRNYWYKSSLNKTMLDALKDIVGGALEVFNFPLHEKMVVVDIGANDGSMLSMFPDSYVKIGFDPAKNLASEADEKCDVFINDYFSASAYPLKVKADIITAIAMFYDLDDPYTFLRDVKEILAEEGVFIVQMTDLFSMLKANAFDNICHEHLVYYSLENMMNLMNSIDLRVFDVEYNEVNGGSLRAYICHMGSSRKTKECVNVALAVEDEYLDLWHDPIGAFACRVNTARKGLASFLHSSASAGKVIYGLGASTKGNTLLQAFNLGRPVIRAIAEVNPDKFGLRTIGSDIPIIPEPQAIGDGPDMFLVLPWHFRDFFIKEFGSYLSMGGSLVFPLPTPQIVTANGVYNL